MLAERTHVVPGAEPRIDSGVIDRIEAGICAIDGIKKWKQVHSAEYTFEWSLKEALQLPDAPSGKTVDVPPSSWLTALETARDRLTCTYFDCIGNFGNSPGYMIQCDPAVSVRSAGPDRVYFTADDILAR